MDIQTLKRRWKEEEAQAHIHGWDFSHIEGRYKIEETLTWDYRTVVCSYLSDGLELLDIDTGGGEFLLSLGHPHGRTAATEGYPPNVELCRKVLLPLGIDFREMADPAEMPFDKACFDLIINRHGSYCVPELWRVLKPGGVFITEQVGEENDRELAELLLPGTPKPFPGLNLREQTRLFEQSGFELIKADECFPPIRFYDVGALVWFAHIIEWEFPGFSVDACFDGLLKAQRILEEQGAVEGTAHRFLLAAQKPEDG